MGQKPEEEPNNLMEAGLGLGGAAFAAQTGRAPSPVPTGGNLSSFAQRVAANDAARQAAAANVKPTTPSTQIITQNQLATQADDFFTEGNRGKTGTRGGSKKPPVIDVDAGDFSTATTKRNPFTSFLSNVVKGSILGAGFTPNEMGDATITGAIRRGVDAGMSNEELISRYGQDAFNAAFPYTTIEMERIGLAPPSAEQMLGQAGVPNMNQLISGMQEMGQTSATSEETAPQPPEISVMKTPEQVISEFGALTGVPNLENVSTAMQNPAVFTPASPSTPGVPAPLSPIDTTFESQGQTMAIPAGGSFEDRFVPTAQQLAEFEQQQPAPGTPRMQEFAGGTVGERPAELTRTIDPMTGQVVFADPATAGQFSQQILSQYTSPDRIKELTPTVMRNLQRGAEALRGTAGFPMTQEGYERQSELRDTRMEEGKRMRDAQLPGGAATGTFTKSELNRIAKGQARDATDREKAEAMEILQRSGQYDPITGKREPTEAEKTREQLEIDYIQGRIDNLAPTATEKEKDQLEIDLLEAQIKKAKESLEPEDIEVVVKGGWSYITKNGQYQIGRFIDLEDKTPAGIREADQKVQRIKKARDLYQRGDKTGAQDILASLDIKDMAGLPAQADDYFGDDQADNSNTITDYGFGDKGNADIQKAIGANPGVSVGDIIKEMISKGKL